MEKNSVVSLVTILGSAVSLVYLIKDLKLHPPASSFLTRLPNLFKKEASRVVQVDTQKSLMSFCSRSATPSKPDKALVKIMKNLSYLI